MVGELSQITMIINSYYRLATSSIAFFVVPVVILTCIYVRIFAAASKNSRDIRRNSFHQSTITASRSSEVKGGRGGCTTTEDCFDDVNEDDKVNHKKAFLQNTAEMGPDKTIPMNSSAPDFLSSSEQNKGTTSLCQIHYRIYVVGLWFIVPRRIQLSCLNTENCSFTRMYYSVRDLQSIFLPKHLFWAGWY